MTDVRSNMFGKYSENDLRVIREENRIMEMRWQVFEGLYDTTRQELERLGHVQNENIGLTTAVPVLQEEIIHKNGIIDLRDSMINRLEEEVAAFRKLAEEAVAENEKLHKQIALYIDPLKELENVVEQTNL